jgi:hypothetical protein
MVLDRELLAGLACVGSVALSGLGLMFALLLATRSPVHPLVPTSKLPTGEQGDKPVLDYGRDLPDPSHLPEFLRNAETDATRAALEFGGTLAGVETRRGRIVGMLWISPARDLLALAVAGHAGSLLYARITIYSPRADGRLLVTLNRRDARDMTGLQVEDVLANARLAELLEHHLRRLRSNGIAALPFTESSPHAALLAIYERIVNARVQRGYARFVDATDGTAGMWWTYTARGAMRFIVQSLTTWDGPRQIRREMFHPTPGNPIVLVRDLPELVRWTEPQDSVRATIQHVKRKWFWMAIRVNLLTLVVIAAAHYFLRSHLPAFPWQNIYLGVGGYVLLLCTPALYLQMRRRGLRKASHQEISLTAAGIVLGRGEIRWEHIRAYRVEPVPLAPRRRQVIVRHARSTTLLLPEAPEDETILGLFRERLGPPG